MASELYIDCYPKECNNEKILPYLRISDESESLSISARSVKEDFFKKCNEYGIKSEKSYCYIFPNIEKLYEFISDDSFPSGWIDYIQENINDNMICIIWVR